MPDVPGIDDVVRRTTDGSSSALAQLAACEANADAWEPALGIYLHRAGASARAAAAEVDRRAAAGHDAGPLAGVPVGVKDIVRTYDAPTTGQSRVSPWTDPTCWGPDAPVVARLRAAGAVITGKTTTLEHALGFSDTEHGFPMPRNPWDPTRWTGGSSSGSGSGLAVGAFVGAVGTDTAGSIRMPAAWCGVTGLKPTYGRIPRTGVLPLAWTLDHVGPMARSARDCAVLLDVLAGASGGHRAPAPPLDLHGLRVGLLTDALARAEGSVQDAVRSAVQVLAHHGAEIVEVAAPHHDAGIAATMLSMASEAFTVHRADLATRWAEFSRATRAATLSGLMTSAADLTQISRVRRHLVDEVDTLLDSVDVLVGPTASTTAPDLDALDFGEVVASMQTVYWNATGHPAVSLPAGFVDGMPVGLQAIGRRGADHSLLAFGEAFQELTEHHRAMPTPGVPAGAAATSGRTPMSAPVPDGGDLAALETLLHAHGITPEPDEVLAAAASWPGLRASTESLWDVPLPPGAEPHLLPAH